MERILPLISLLSLLLFIASCGQTRYVPTREVYSKVQELARHRIDSIHLIDSIYVHTKGDTVYQTRWRTLLRERKIIDTLRVTERDTIPYPVVVEQPHRPTFRTRIEVWLWRVVGGTALGYLLLQVVIRLWRKG